MKDLLFLVNNALDLYEVEMEEEYNQKEFFKEIGLKKRDDINSMSVKSLERTLCNTAILFAERTFYQYDDVYEWKAMVLNELQMSLEDLEHIGFHFLI